MIKKNLYVYRLKQLIIIYNFRLIETFFSLGWWWESQKYLRILSKLFSNKFTISYSWIVRAFEKNTSKFRNNCIDQTYVCDIIFYLYKLNIQCGFKIYVYIFFKVFLKMFSNKVPILTLKMTFNLGLRMQKQDSAEKSNFFCKWIEIVWVYYFLK